MIDYSASIEKFEIMLYMYICLILTTIHPYIHFQHPRFLSFLQNP